MDQPNQTFVQSSLFEQGIGEIVVARRKGAESIEFGLFLLDTFCLGVKDATFAKVGLDEFHHVILPKIFKDIPYEVRDGAWGRKLIEDAIAYAANLGISPHPDYKKGARVFGGIRASDCLENFTFGKDGKPFYIQGDLHSPATAKRIINILRARLGDDGFDYIVEADEFLGGRGDIDEAYEDEEEMAVLVSDTHPESSDARADYNRILDKLREQNPSDFDHANLVLDADGALARDLLNNIRAVASDYESAPSLSGLDELRLHAETFRFLSNLRLLPPEAREVVGEEFSKLGGENDTLKKIIAELDNLPEGAEFPYVYHCEVLDTGGPEDPRLIVFCEMPYEQ